MSKSSGKLTVVQLNDSHAYFELHPEWFWEAGEFVYRQAGGYARIATLVRQIREESSGQFLFCDNGDTLNGTRPAVETNGEAVIPVINELGIDAMALHWEFAYGPETLVKQAAKLNFPVLAINVYREDSNELLFSPTAVKQIGDLKVGLIGIASNIVDKTMPPAFSEGVRFTLGNEELPGHIESLRTRDQVDLIILISHLGFPQDMKLLSEVKGIDLCLSGHTHNRITEAIRQGQTLVIQSGCHGSFLGRIDLDIDNGEITAYEHQLIEVSEAIEPAADIDKIIDRELAAFRERLEEVVGETQSALNRATMLESTMDNFLLQAMLDHSEAELAFSNGWRYGAPIIPGPITLNELYNIVPMDPPLQTADLTGEELKEMLEENLERTFAGNPYDQMGGFVKRSLGFRAFIKIENPRGERIQALFIDGKALDSKRSYRTVFITEQGVPGKYGQNRQKLPVHAVQVMRNYLQKRSPIEVSLLETFTIV